MVSMMNIVSHNSDIPKIEIVLPQTRSATPSSFPFGA